MSIFTDFFSSAWSRIKTVFKDDVEPTLEAFLKQFSSDEGHLILTTAIAAAPALATGNFGVIAGQVLSTVVSQSEALAAQDVTKTLQQVQSALQIAKVANNVLTPGDQQIIATATAPSAAPSDTAA
jgi:hypothetical protein